MARYLIVTNQTAFDPELRKKLGELLVEDPAAEFSLVVPEVPNLNFSWEGESVDVAKQRAEAIRAALEQTTDGQVGHVAVGVSDPLQAITDELSEHPAYDVLVICTLPIGLSRWLKLDLVHHAERKFGLPVIHVVGHSVRV